MQNKVNPEKVLNIITTSNNIKEEDNFIVSYITVYAFLFVIMAITISSTYPATVVEKERGTLETLLTFPIKSKDIIVGKCKSFKEAQSALTPLTFISFFPGMIAFMANLKSSTLYSAIPFLNFTLIFTDTTNNIFNMINILLMIGSTIIITFVVLRRIISQYKSENVLF